MKLDLPDFALVLGAGLIVAGAAMIYTPAAFLVAGCLCIGFAYLHAAALPRKED
jgi:hypothetical protein